MALESANIFFYLLLILKKPRLSNNPAITYTGLVRPLSFDLVLLWPRHSNPGEEAYSVALCPSVYVP